MNCPECGKKVSEDASSCPQCGYTERQGFGEQLVMFLIWFGIISAVVWASVEIGC